MYIDLIHNTHACMHACMQTYKHTNILTYIHTVHTLNTLHTIHTLHTLHTLHKLHTLHTLCEWGTGYSV